MKKFIKIVLLGFLLIAIIGVIIINLPKESSKNKRPDFDIEANALFEEFDKKEQKANSKYLGKTIQVSGTINSVEKDEKESTVLILSSSDPIAGVMCTLEEGQEKKLEYDPVGQRVVIKGMCTGKLMDVVLNKCVIVE